MSQEPTTTTTSSTALPTFGGSMGSYQLSAAAASIVALLDVAELYTKMKQCQTDQMMSQLDAAQAEAIGAKDELYKAADEQWKSALTNASATIAGGLCQAGGGAVTMGMASSNSAQIKNAQSYKDAASTQLKEGGEVSIGDINSGANPAYGERVGALRENMQNGDFDFGAQSVKRGDKVVTPGGREDLSEAEAAIKTSSREELEVVIKKADDFIANKSAETARGTPWHYVLNGLGDIFKGVGGLVSAGFDSEKTQAEADSALISAAQNNAQKMVDTFSQQFNASNQTQTSIYQTLGQIMQSVVYQG